MNLPHNTAYDLWQAMRESRRAIKAADQGQRHRGMIHLSNAWRHLGAAAVARPRYLSARGYWARLACVETTADKARDALASL